MPPRSVDVGRRPELAVGELEYDTWAELLIKSSHNSFGRHDAGQKFGPWVRRPLTAADECKPPPPPTLAEAEHRPDIARKQRIECYRQEMMQVVRDMPVDGVEEVAAFELSFRDIVEAPPAKIQPAARENLGKQWKQRREARSKTRGGSGFFLIKTLVLAAVGGRRKIAGGGVEKAAKVSPNPCQGKYEERICSGGRSDHGEGGRNKGRGSCYLFLKRDRSRPIEI